MTHPDNDTLTLDPPLLRLRDLGKHFTLHLRDAHHLDVLQGVSLDVRRGQCMALVGRSGQGKSTLIKCLYGSYGASAGGIWWTRKDGQTVDLATATPREWMALRRRDIAYVSQFLRSVPRVSALDVVAERYWTADERLVDERRDQVIDEAREQAGRLLARLNLPEHLWHLPPATFSGGEQQRVNIARGFIVPARLLLLDEPTASLDAFNRRVVVELIREAKAAGVAVVGIFHDEEVRDAVADTCITLSG